MKGLGFLMFFVCTSCFCQNSYHFVLFNKSDSLPLPFANIRLSDTLIYISTNEKGEAEIPLPSGIREIGLIVSSVGCHANGILKVIPGTTGKIYLDCGINSLKEIEVQSYTAKEILRRAINAIPVNHPDTSFASFGFYRQYQKINGHFRNLLEAKLCVMYNISGKGGELKAKEAVATVELRRADLFKAEGLNAEIGSPLFFKEDPIYHLKENLLNPNAINFYSICFDSLSIPDKYVIRYTCSDFINDRHGISNYTADAFEGEGTEEGILQIDKGSFAFVKIERHVKRNKKYNYPKNNNFIWPDLKFTGELLSGDLYIEYKKEGTKWFPSSLFYTYSNNFFYTGIYQKAYEISDFYEWTAEENTRLIKKELLDKFFFDPKLYFQPVNFHKSEWIGNQKAYYFHKKQEVYKDMAGEAAFQQYFLSTEQ